MRLTGESRFASLKGDSKVLEMHGNVILKFLKRLIRTTGGPKLGCIEHDARTIQAHRKRSNLQRIEAGQPNCQSVTIIVAQRAPQCGRCYS
jgi:hypothetical protein